MWYAIVNEQCRVIWTGESLSGCADRWLGSTWFGRGHSPEAATLAAIRKVKRSDEFNSSVVAAARRYVLAAGETKKGDHEAQT